MKTLILILLLSVMLPGCLYAGAWMYQARKYPECSTCQNVDEQKKCIDGIIAKEGRVR